MNFELHTTDFCGNTVIFLFKLEMINLLFICFFLTLIIFVLKFKIFELQLLNQNTINKFVIS